MRMCVTSFDTFRDSTDQMTERGPTGGNVSPARAPSVRSVPDAAARGARPEAAGVSRLAERAFGTPRPLIAPLRGPGEPTAHSQEGRILAALRAGYRLT